MAQAQPRSCRRPHMDKADENFVNWQEAQLALSTTLSHSTPHLLRVHSEAADGALDVQNESIYSG